MNDEWIEKTVPIKKIKELLNQGYEVEVDSPDGYVGVSQFVNKGSYEEYILYSPEGRIVRSNGEHLFETTIGWSTAAQIYSSGGFANILHEDGKFKECEVKKTGDTIPIVDIQVEHDNHRYYTEGISSHNTGVGKTLAMCHFAATNLMVGKNVLYITLEMAEERIAERIDANLLGIELDDLEKMSRDMYVSKVEKLRKKTPGNLIVKEYPPGIAGANHFRHLLNELKLKKQFVPDIIYVDYINLAVSHRLKGARDYNSYTYIKTIAEELRGLAVESDVPLISATQLNRDGYTNSDPDLDSTSESFGLPMTADFMLAMITSEQLEDSNQIMVKQLKNRYSDVANYRKFVVGINKAKMRLYNVDSHQSKPQTEEDDDIPVHDRSGTAPGAVRSRKLWQE